MASALDDELRALDPELVALMASDTSELLYAYSHAGGGWWVDAPPPGPGVPSPFGNFGPHWIPFDLTHLAITRAAVYWRAWRSAQIPKKSIFGREQTERRWLKQAISVGIAHINSIKISRDGYEPSTDFTRWPAEQHLALELFTDDQVVGRLYNWAPNSADLMQHVAEIFEALEVAIEDPLGVLGSGRRH